MTSVNPALVLTSPPFAGLALMCHVFPVNKRAFRSSPIQGDGVRPASRLLRGVPVRPPPGRHRGAGGRLEGGQRRRRRVGVRVGDADGGEAVGDAQQVGGPQAQLTKYTRNFYFRLNPGIIDILFLLIHVLLFAKLSKSDTNKIIVSAD